MNKISIFLIYLLYAGWIFIGSGCSTLNEPINPVSIHTNWTYFQYENTSQIEEEQIDILKNTIEKIIVNFLKNQSYHRAIFTFHDMTLLFQQNIVISFSGQIQYNRTGKVDSLQQSCPESIYYYYNNDDWQGEITGKLFVSQDGDPYIEYPLKAKRIRFMIRSMHFRSSAEWSSFLSQHSE